MGMRLFRGRERKSKGCIKRDMETKIVRAETEAIKYENNYMLSNKKCEIATR